MFGLHISTSVTRAIYSTRVYIIKIKLHRASASGQSGRCEQRTDGCFCMARSGRTTNKQTFVSSGHVAVVVTGSKGGVVVVGRCLCIHMYTINHQVHQPCNTQCPALYTTPNTARRCICANQLHTTIALPCLGPSS